MSILGAVASVAGGLIGSSDAKKANKQQMDLAKNSIKYRVQDAKNSGIHPLYALGAPTLSSSMQTNPMGQAVANAGSEIGKTMISAYEKEIQELNLQNARADLTAKKLRNADFIKQSIDNSRMAKINATLGANADAKDVMEFGGGVKVKPRYTPASKGEDYFGETGIPYTIWNTLDHLAEDAPKAREAIEAYISGKWNEETAPVKRWWRSFKKKRGW